jgi:hypothetical protein
MAAVAVQTYVLYMFSNRLLIFARSLRGGDSHGHAAPQAPGLEGKIRAIPSEYLVIGIVGMYVGVYKLATSGKKEEAAPAPAAGH